MLKKYRTEKLQLENNKNTKLDYEVSLLELIIFLSEFTDFTFLKFN